MWMGSYFVLMFHGRPIIYSSRRFQVALRVDFMLSLLSFILALVHSNAQEESLSQEKKRGESIKGKFVPK